MRPLQAVAALVSAAVLLFGAAPMSGKTLTSGREPGTESAVEVSSRIHRDGTRATISGRPVENPTDSFAPAAPSSARPEAWFGDGSSAPKAAAPISANGGNARGYSRFRLGSTNDCTNSRVPERLVLLSASGDRWADHSVHRLCWLDRHRERGSQIHLHTWLLLTRSRLHAVRANHRLRNW